MSSAGNSSSCCSAICQRSSRIARTAVRNPYREGTPLAACHHDTPYRSAASRPSSGRQSRGVCGDKSTSVEDGSPAELAARRRGDSLREHVRSASRQSYRGVIARYAVCEQAWLRGERDEHRPGVETTWPCAIGGDARTQLDSPHLDFSSFEFAGYSADSLDSISRLQRVLRL